MVSDPRRVFIVAGLDFLQRKASLNAIKSRILQQKSTQLNILTFYGKEIDIRLLEEHAFTFSFDREKIVIIKDAYNLSREIREFLLQNYKKIVSTNYIILEIERDYFQLRRDKKIVNDKFFSFIFRQAVSFKAVSRQRQVSLEDFKRSIRKKDLSSSLYFLEKLFERGNTREMGPLILGILVRETAYSNNFFDKEKKFSHLWEADRAIKEKGIDTKLAIELLLAKLFSSPAAAEI
ncbi:MAG: hypothetical protein JSV34_02250 [Candidatus Omnitrophota bacterium]|nr:MAG: hypothetical protein JSV34_02250 [Candidatus Omnitrophota bacterium]